MIARHSFLKRGAPPKRKSWLKRSTKRIPQVNVGATRRRRARNAKRMRGPEYKAARAGAMERSGGQCEWEVQILGPVEEKRRCPETRALHFHEEHYARGRILTAADGKMLCWSHHRRAEKQKPHKWAKRGF